LILSLSLPSSSRLPGKVVVVVGKQAPVRLEARASGEAIRQGLMVRVLRGIRILRLLRCLVRRRRVQTLMDLLRCLCREVWAGIILLVLRVERMFDVGVETSVVGERIEDRRCSSLEMLHFFAVSFCQHMLSSTYTVLLFLCLLQMAFITQLFKIPPSFNHHLDLVIIGLWNTCFAITLDKSAFRLIHMGIL
jgi:hypothetical protein